jgi:hypothetical protein
MFEGPDLNKKRITIDASYLGEVLWKI